MALELATMWNYADPAASEQCFRAALVDARGDDALVLQTQIARSHGLRRDFAEARRILAGIESTVGGGSAEARVRYALELGRTYASAAHAAEELTSEAREKARVLYLSAFAQAQDARLDALAIDALHMMVCVDTAPQDQLGWNLKAIACLEKSDQADAKKWEGSLRNNVGYAYFLLGQHDEALAHYRHSLAAHERNGRPANVRIAHWMIARTFRAQGKIDEATLIQLRLEREWDEAGQPDPYVYEELEQLYRAAGQVALADDYGAKLRKSRPAP